MFVAIKAGGGRVIDTPGMRTLHVSDAAHGIHTLFSEITELAPLCKFRDCTHAHEPGCAVRVAVSESRLDPERLARWRMMVDENRKNTSEQAGPADGKTNARRRPRLRSEAD
jgi:ribosome biogenesis GTPase